MRGYRGDRERRLCQYLQCGAGEVGRDEAITVLEPRIAGPAAPNYAFELLPEPGVVLILSLLRDFKRLDVVVELHFEHAGDVLRLKFTVGRSEGWELCC